MTNLSDILYILLFVLSFAVIVLFFVFIMMKAKEKNGSTTNKVVESKPVNTPDKATKITTKTSKEYDVKSVFDFMEFEGVKDNMIIQKNGKRFLMVIECQGVNYDLMSEVEKTSTERGFATFLNTLKEPIQIYIQTRTVNLEKNIQSYKEKLKKLGDDLNLKEYRLKQYMQSSHINEEVLKDKQIEVIRQANLYNYGRDVIANTEKMSLNKNVLKKKYYIVIKYFYESTDSDEEEVLGKEEIEEIAFSNLYTRAVSLIRVLSGIGIIGKSLNSIELVDLLYNAYNRDDSEVFGIERAMESGYNEIYVDAQSSIDKKIEALNKEIQVRAKQKANDTLKQIEDERSAELTELEENLEDIIAELAKNIIEDDNNNIPAETKRKAIEKIEEKTTKGEKKSNGKSKTK